jgi:hypothetical protein
MECEVIYPKYERGYEEAEIIQLILISFLRPPEFQDKLEQGIVKTKV